MNIPMIIFLFILIAGGLLGLEIYRELHHFRVTHYTIESQKFKGFSRDLNLIFLSDLHNRVYGEKNEPLLQAIRNEKPDLILIGGDMLVGKEDASYDIALDFTSQLPQIAPVLYATGNHEQRMRENPEIYQSFLCRLPATVERQGCSFFGKWKAAGLKQERFSWKFRVWNFHPHRIKS